MKIERMTKAPQPGAWGKVKAYFDVMTEEGFTIKGFKVIDGINGLFVSNPSIKGKDDEYRDTVFIAQETREELSQLALQTYGMEKPAEDLSFPAENHEQAFASETKTPETINGVGSGHSEGGAEKDTNDFSEDDIPF